MTEVERVLGIGNLLGEGPLWDAKRQVLFWVDIERSRFYCFCPATAYAETVATSIPIYALGLVEDPAKLIMATARGLDFWYLHQRSLEAISSNPEPGRLESRFNDAAVDRQGNLWVGSLGPGLESALYRLGAERLLRKMDMGIGVSNGISWSPDNRTMYLTDSSRRSIFAYDFDESSSLIENRRVLIKVPDGEGIPDGLTVDREGFLWSTRWGGARIARYDPAGRLEREVILPVTYPTSCAFGGANLDELYITSARSPLTESQFKREPSAGDLFRIWVGVQGFEESRFRR